MLLFSGLTAIACAIMSLIAGGTSPRIFFAISFGSFLGGYFFLDSFLICMNLQKEIRKHFVSPRIAAGRLLCRPNWTSKAIAYNVILILDVLR